MVKKVGEKADFTMANLNGLDLRGANLEKAEFFEAHLKGANLEGANLRDANFRRARLDGANLKGACLIGAQILRAVLTDANFREANLTETHFSGTLHTCNPTDFTDAIFSTVGSGWKITRITKNE